MKKIILFISLAVFCFCSIGIAADSGPPSSPPGLWEKNADGTIGPKKDRDIKIPGSVSVKSTAHGSISTGTVTLTPGVHTITVAGNQTWAFSGWPASGTEGKMTIYVTNGGSATITGLAGPIFSGGGEPSLTSSGRDVLVFTTTDGGTTIWGFVSGLDVQ